MALGTCPLCGKSARLGGRQGRTILAHQTPRQHLPDCRRQGVSGDCASCGFAVFRDGRGCRGTGRIAVEARVYVRPGRNSHYDHPPQGEET